MDMLKTDAGIEQANSSTVVYNNRILLAQVVLLPEEHSGFAVQIACIYIGIKKVAACRWIPANTGWY